MKESLSSRERMLLAMTNRQPDRIPVAPDISNMVPCRLTGKPFWEIYRNQNPPLWKAYLDAARFYGFDAWFIYGHLDLKVKPQCEFTSEVISQTDDAILVRNNWRTPAGDIYGQTLFSRDMPPIPHKRPMEKLPDDFEKWKYVYGEFEGYETSTYEAMKKETGELGPVNLGLWLPGFQTWCDTVEGSVEALTFAYYDHPELFDEWRLREESRIFRMLDYIVEVKPDYVLIGASGLLTLQSPEIFRALSLPALKEITHRCRQAGIPTMLHSCGKERYLVEVFANETDLDCVNPLERPPMGDCDLREVKEKFGHRMALMGNLHTTETMLRGTLDDVERACLEALDAAKGEGGFILSTGDQCGRDTPDENIFKMVETAKRYGVY